jgi:hypothetical protein
MKQRAKRRLLRIEVLERCSECGHLWTDSGPAHYADCRYFSLDDDRDEESNAQLDVLHPFTFLEHSS